MATDCSRGALSSMNHDVSMGTTGTDKAEKSEKDMIISDINLLNQMQSMNLSSPNSGGVDGGLHLAGRGPTGHHTAQFAHNAET